MRRIFAALTRGATAIPRDAVARNQWFTRYSPTERLDYVDREWAEIQDFIKEYSLLKHGTRKK